MVVFMGRPRFLLGRERNNLFQLRTLNSREVLSFRCVGTPCCMLLFKPRSFFSFQIVVFPWHMALCAISLITAFPQMLPGIYVLDFRSHRVNTLSYRSKSYACSTLRGKEDARFYIQRRYARNPSPSKVTLRK